MASATKNLITHLHPKDFNFTVAHMPMNANDYKYNDIGISITPILFSLVVLLTV